MTQGDQHLIPMRYPGKSGVVGISWRDYPTKKSLGWQLADDDDLTPVDGVPLLGGRS